MPALAFLSMMLLLLAGCSADREAGAVFDQAIFDRVPVVPVQMPDGNGSGLLLPEGTLLTCSHVVPRGQPRGRVRVTGPWIAYEVKDSGDGLALTWSQSSGRTDTHMDQDWATLSLEPRIDPDTLFDHPSVFTVAHSPPRPRDQLFLVGYTVQGDRFVRCWVPLRVCDAGPLIGAGRGQFAVRVVTDGNHQSGEVPAARRPGSSEEQNRLSLGFSGAPVWRVGEDRRPELCGMLVAADLDATGTPTTLGFAIVPRPLRNAASEQTNTSR